jgi:hypothetical protein
MDQLPITKETTTILNPNILGLIITNLIKMASMNMASVNNTVDSEILIRLQRVRFVEMNWFDQTKVDASDTSCSNVDKIRFNGGQ